MTNFSKSILDNEIDNENLINDNHLSNPIDITTNNKEKPNVDNINNNNNNDFKLYSTSNNNLSPPTITPFNSKFFKDIDQTSKDNESNSIIDNIKKSFTRLHDNNTDNNININEEDEFGNFNGANGSNHQSNIKLQEIRSSSPTKININNKSVEPHDAFFSEINDHHYNDKGSLLANSSSSFVEKVTLKERIRYFFIFLIHNIKTSTPLTWLKLFFVACIITGVFLAIFKFKVQNHLDVLQKFVQKFGVPLGGLVYVGAFMLLIVFLVPVTIPTIVGGMIFKLWFGILFVWVASMLGGILAFSLVD
ncbi:hypothetical protein DICPUDRAFT_100104, partial [Dictyostelium purpureum]